jgi:hypothetical protein
MIFLGIDPGLHGAVAWMDGERKQIHVDDCPLVDGYYDFRRMAELVRSTFSWSLDGDGNHVSPTVTMEMVHALPTDGKCSAFSFGVGFGAWLGVFGALGLVPHLVPPQTWKRTMLAGIANNKAAEAMALKQRFQGHAICSELYGPRGGVRDGRVDALFLAEFGRVNWKLSGRRAA